MTTPGLTGSRRLYLFSIVPGPLLAMVMAFSTVVRVPRDKIESNTVWAVGIWVAVALAFLAYGYAKRNSPSLWRKITGVSALFFGVVTALAAASIFLVLGMGTGGTVGLGFAVFLLGGVAPWLAVGRASVKLMEQPTAALVDSEVELSFPLRGEDDGWFLVGQDEVVVRIRRRVRRQLDDNHDDRVYFTGIREIELVQLHGQEETHVGLGYEAHATAGPAVRLLIADDSRGDEPEEWIVATDRAWEAIQAIESRRYL
ncbi:MAG: hypothetical protein QOI21_6272 [Actinomycetota bacterium]|jgi:hypothetical protein|nr:hypothetical protein [Actinomycetota bacterium]